MKYRSLVAQASGRALGLSSSTTFGDSVKDQTIVRNVIGAARERGVNFFDMANASRAGVEAHDRRSAQTLPATHARARERGVQADERRRQRPGLSRKHIVEAIDKSLARIGTNYLDIYFCHRGDPERRSRRSCARSTILSTPARS